MPVTLLLFPPFKEIEDYLYPFILSRSAFLTVKIQDSLTNIFLLSFLYLIRVPGTIGNYSAFRVNLIQVKVPL